jgi:hypothetical protein
MTLFRNLFPRRQTRREAELAYLNAAVSLYDLERRRASLGLSLPKPLYLGPPFGAAFFNPQG